ncbi:MAG TPA: hypothetical protein VF950_14535, partial [Planctomycetota bacterium]
MARSKVLVLGGAVVLAAAIVGVALLFPAAPPPEEAPAEAPVRPTSVAPSKPAAAAPRLDNDDRAAQAMFEAASTPSAYREVWLKYPETVWGKRAEEKFRAMDTTARAAVDRGFEDVRRRAAGLAP